MPDVAYGVGVDIGTTTVVAAIRSGDPGDDAAPEVVFRAELPAILAAWAARRPLTDAGRLWPPRDLLDRVGDPVPVTVGERLVPAADLVAEVVRALVELITESAGHPPSWTAVAVPPSWSGHRLTALGAALQDAGLAESAPVSSAVATVRAQLRAGELPPEGTAVVVDVGAGTSDVAVVCGEPDGVLAHRTVPPAALRWGGRDVDDAVLRHVRRCLDLPARIDPRQAAALRAACATAKEAASLQTEVDVAVDPAWSETGVRMTREELEVLVADDVERLAESVTGAIAAAGLTPADVDAVLLTGGAVRMPLVVERLSAELEVPLSAAADPSLTPALGAALLAADRIAADATDTGADEQGPAGPASTPSSGRRRADHRPSRGSRPSGRGRAPSRPGERPPDAGRQAFAIRRAVVVSGVFLLLMLGAPMALGLLGVYRGGVAEESTAAADDPGVSDTGTAQTGLSGSSRQAAAATSNAAQVRAGTQQSSSSHPGHGTAARSISSSGTGGSAGSSSASADGTTTAAAGMTAADAVAVTSTTPATTDTPTTPPTTTDTPTVVTPPDPPATGTPTDPPTTSDPGTPPAPPPSSSEPPAPPAPADPPAGDTTGGDTTTTPTTTAPETDVVSGEPPADIPASEPAA